GSQVYPAGRGSYLSGTIVKASDGLLYKCNAGVAAWCNSSAEWAYAPATGSATSSAWTVQSCN
ncbi:MAG: glycosyl hydrolase, partial [Burkholderiaceae bacterium]|nr:glycosyl hydrolase [Burkholderiaceae bacterium]